MSSNWYEVVLDKFGTIENFVDNWKEPETEDENKCKLTAEN